jgi:hypothetical protein
VLRCALGPTTSMRLWAIIERLILKRASKPSVLDKGLKFDAAVVETKAALALLHEASMALLCGLCAIGCGDTQPPRPTFRSRFDPSRICFVPSNRRPAAGTSRIAVLRHPITSALILVILDCPKWRRGIAAKPGTIFPVRSTYGLRGPSAAPLTDVFSIRLSFPTVGFPQIARRTGPPTASS